MTTPPDRGADDPGAGGAEDDVYVVDTRGRSKPGAGRPVRRSVREPRNQPQRPQSRPRPDGPRFADPRPDGPRPGPGPRPPRRSRARTGRRRILLTVVLVVVAWLAFMIWVPLNAWNSVGRVDAYGADRPAAGAGHNYLLVGSDSRDTMTRSEIAELRTGKADGSRTDSIILVHVPGGDGKAAMVSIPRDSYVPIPGHNSNKINAAYALGGPKLLTATVEEVTGLRLDGYVEIGFTGFVGVVDSLGGVEMCLDAPMKDESSHLDIAAGCQVLDGKTALAFVRARYSDPRGDIGRADRQRQFLGAITKQALTPSTVLIPTRYKSFADASAKGLLVSDDTSMIDVWRVFRAMRGVSSGDTLSLVVPIADANYQTRAGSSVKWDTPRARALFTMLRNDEPLTAPPPGTDGKPSGG